MRFSAEFSKFCKFWSVLKKKEKEEKKRNFETLCLEEITEIVDLVKLFPMRIWLQSSALIRTRTSLLEFALPACFGPLRGRSPWSNHNSRGEPLEERRKPAEGADCVADAATVGVQQPLARPLFSGLSGISFP